MIKRLWRLAASSGSPRHIKSHGVRRAFFAIAVASTTIGLNAGVHAQATRNNIPQNVAPGQFLDQGPLIIRNVQLFDGVSQKLIPNATVLAELVSVAPGKDRLGRPTKGYDIGYFITEISTGELRTHYNKANVRIIDGQGKTLMPGLIDTHVHLSWAKIGPLLEFSKLIQQKQASASDYLEVGRKASLAEAEATLLRGFTSVREVGGIAHITRSEVDPTADKSLPDRTRLKLGKPGPRIWAAGAVISATGGHADAASDLQADGRGLDLLDVKLDELTPDELEHLVHKLDVFGMRTADGVPEVLKAIRDQFVKGANLIKITTGGGVSTPHDPIDLESWTWGEIKAAVETAKGYNTYVTTHQYNSDGIIRDLKAGVRMIEHANLLDDRAARLAAALQSAKDHKGRSAAPWISISPFFENQYANPKDGIYREKQKITQRGTLDAYAFAKKHGFQNLSFGSDPIMERDGGEKSPKILAHLPKDLEPLKRFVDRNGLVKDYSYSNFEIIRMATANNGRVLTMSGPRTPYLGRDGQPLKDGMIGVIKRGAVADLLLVDGNPLESLDFLNDVQSNIRVIVKDGIVYKNTL